MDDPSMARKSRKRVASPCPGIFGGLDNMPSIKSLSFLRTRIVLSLARGIGLGFAVLWEGHSLEEFARKMKPTPHIAVQVTVNPAFRRRTPTARGRDRGRRKADRNPRFCQELPYAWAEPWRKRAKGPPERLGMTRLQFNDGSRFRAFHRK